MYFLVSFFSLVDSGYVDESRLVESLVFGGGFFFGVFFSVVVKIK